MIYMKYIIFFIYQNKFRKDFNKKNMSKKYIWLIKTQNLSYVLAKVVLNINCQNVAKIVNV